LFPALVARFWTSATAAMCPLTPPPRPWLNLLLASKDYLSNSRVSFIIASAAHFPVFAERERERYFKSHISWWEHSSHFRLIGRGVPSVSVVSQLVYNFLWMASPRGNPQVPIRKIRSRTPDLTHRVRLHYP